MPKQAKAGDKSQRKNPTPKSTRYSERTKANKLRRANSRGLKLQRATERRFKTTFTDPATGKERSASRTVRDARAIQESRIARKQATRHRLAKMGRKQRAEARAAGDKQFGRRNVAHFNRCAPKRLKIVQEGA